MSDYISRQAAIDAVCMEWCGVKHKDCEHPFDVEKDDYYWCDGCETALRTLPDLPSAEPEIIRCKDCRHYNAEERMCNDLMGFGRYWSENDFCSFAERRTDE